MKLTTVFHHDSLSEQLAHNLRVVTRNLRIAIGVYLVLAALMLERFVRLVWW